MLLLSKSSLRTLCAFYVSFRLTKSAHCFSISPQKESQQRPSSLPPATATSSDQSTGAKDSTGVGSTISPWDRFLARYTESSSFNDAGGETDTAARTTTKTASLVAFVQKERDPDDGRNSPGIDQPLPFQNPLAQMTLDMIVTLQLLAFQIAV
jgi:hypothetical protein